MTKDFARTTFGPNERIMLRAFAEAMFFPEGDASPETLDGIVSEVDRFVSPGSKMLRFGLRALLFALRWSPLLFRRMRSFESLSLPDRTKHLENLEHARRAKVALLFFAYKTIFTIVHYEAPDALVAIGYPRRTP